MWIICIDNEDCGYREYFEEGSPELAGEEFPICPICYLKCLVLPSADASPSLEFLEDSYADFR